MKALVQSQSADASDQSADIRPLIFRLQQASRQRGARLFAISSAEVGAGGSRCAVALACSCAGLTGFGDVLLVDMNLHRPPIDCTEDTEAGWLEWLEAKTSEPLLDRVQRDPGSRLRILPRGGPGAALLPQDWERVLDLLRAFEGTVILDCPPWFEGPESSAICAAADGVVLVIEAGRSRRALVRQMVDDLRRLERDSGFELLGVVMNQRRYPIPGWLYRRLF